MCVFFGIGRIFALQKFVLYKWRCRHAFVVRVSFVIMSMLLLLPVCVCVFIINHNLREKKHIFFKGDSSRVCFNPLTF